MSYLSGYLIQQNDVISPQTINTFVELYIVLAICYLNIGIPIMPRLQTDYKTMFCQIIAMLWLIGAASCNFLPVPEGCKYWDYLKVYGNGEKHLHCILDQAYQSGLVYTTVKKIEKGRCPIYNRYARQIDSIDCISDIGDCPQKIIESYEGITYSGCYDNIWKKEKSLMKPTTNKDGHTPSTPACVDTRGYQITLAVMTLLICTFIAWCIWHFICRSKIQVCRDEYGPVVKKNNDSVAPAEYKSDQYPLLESGNMAEASPPIPKPDTEEKGTEAQSAQQTSDPDTNKEDAIKLRKLRKKYRHEYGPVVERNNDNVAPAEYKSDQYPLLESGNMAEASPPIPKSDTEEKSTEAHSGQQTSDPDTNKEDAIKLAKLREKYRRDTLCF